MLCREIIAVYSEIHKKTLFGHNVAFWMLKPVVDEVTTRL